MPAVFSFYVPKISCHLCVASIEKKLTEIEGLPIVRVASNVNQKKIGVLLREEVDEALIRTKLIQSLQSIGFKPVFSGKAEVEKQTFDHLVKGAIGTVSGIALLIVALVFAPLARNAMLLQTVFSSLLTLYLGKDSYLRSYYELRAGKTSMDTLFAISTSMVFFSTIASIFIPWFPMLCETGLLIFGFRHLGKGIEGWLNHAMQFGVFFIDRLPKMVKTKTRGTIHLKELARVEVGEIIEISSGEYVPLDGECLEEGVFVYDTILSGATLPRELKKGEMLLSGMEVAEGSRLRLRVTKPFTKSHLYRLDQRIFDTEFEEKAGYEMTANAILKYFVPAVVLLAIVSALTVGYFFQAAIAVRCFIAVLVSACPCTLGLVVPLAVSIAKYKAADNGIEFKSGEKLQLASEVDCVVFDFNGTLTTGIPKIVREYRSPKAINPQTFYQIIAQLEKQTRHPVGHALFNHVKEKAQEGPSVPVERKYFGVMGVIDGKTYLLGSKAMMVEHNVSLTTLSEKPQLDIGESAVYLACDGKIVGYFVLATSLRAGAKSAVQQLQQMGIDCFICSGSDREMLEGFAKELGIGMQNINANQRGSLDGQGKDDDKSRFIRTLQKKGYKVVAMVGDAVNDVLALDASDFGLAICHDKGDEKVTEKASAVVKGESLLPVVNTFVISKRMKKNIFQNLVMSLSYNVLVECVASGALVATGIVLNPSLGAALMVLQMCLILGNAYRFKQQPLARLADQPLLRTQSALPFAKTVATPGRGIVKEPRFYPHLIKPLPKARVLDQAQQLPCVNIPK